MPKKSIYRNDGQLVAAWRLLDRDNHPPYVDSTPLAQPGVPEVREYRLMGVWSDQEVGQPSDVASITVA